MTHSVDGHCPKCKTLHGQTEEDGPQSLIQTTKPIFTGDFTEPGYEPWYVWVELHQCTKTDCGALYYFHTGT